MFEQSVIEALQSIDESLQEQVKIMKVRNALLEESNRNQIDINKKHEAELEKQGAARVAVFEFLEDMGNKLKILERSVESLKSGV